MTKPIDNLESHISDAVAHYWRTRKAQGEKQKTRGIADDLSFSIFAKSLVSHIGAFA